MTRWLRIIVLAALAMFVVDASPHAALAQTKPPADASDDEDAEEGPEGELEIPASAAKQEIDLVVGENKTISALGVRNYSEGKPGIADVRLTTDGSKFVLVGRNPGQTTLLLLFKDETQVSWTINVFARSPDEVESEVADLLQRTPGIRVRRIGARFFIEGGVSSDAEAKRIQRIAELYPGQVESLVVAGAGAADRKLNLRIDFFFVEYRRGTGFQFGVDYPTRYGGEAIQSELTYDFLKGTATSATTTVLNHPMPALDIAANYGWAKVLKQSTVITVNGVEAHFSSGGEQNYRIAGALTAEIQSLSFGTDVTVLPRLDPDSGDLEIEMKAKVTDLIPPIDGTDLPGRAISELVTIARMKLGQSLVLSGIKTRQKRVAKRGLPGLSRIPVLGVLFGSEQIDEEEIEGAIFIVPTAVEAIPEKASKRVDEALSQYLDFKGKLEVVEPYQSRPDAWDAEP